MPFTKEYMLEKSRQRKEKLNKEMFLVLGTLATLVVAGHLVLLFIA